MVVAVAAALMMYVASCAAGSEGSSRCDHCHCNDPVSLSSSVSATQSGYVPHEVLTFNVNVFGYIAASDGVRRVPAPRRLFHTFHNPEDIDLGRFRAEIVLILGSTSLNARKRSLENPSLFRGFRSLGEISHLSSVRISVGAWCVRTLN